MVVGCQQLEDCAAEEEVMSWRARDSWHALLSTNNMSLPSHDETTNTEGSARSASRKGKHDTRQDARAF